jgi:hypothetical protein
MNNKKEKSTMSRKTESQETVGTVVIEQNSEPEPAVAPSEEQIAALAYSYWEARGNQGGSSEEDWFRAEKELRERQSQPGTATIQAETPRTMGQSG